MEIYDKRDDVFDEAFVGGDMSQESEVLQFYENQTIFITGASGFLGILLVEKLLRTCSNLKKIILLVREKRGKSTCSRIREMFDNKVFEKMKLRNPHYNEQVEILDGCCRKPNLGLTDEQMRKLQSEVNIIFHLAANVRFDEPIRSIYEVNVAGTEMMLDIAKDIRNLKAFVYVSTAYSQSHLPKIEEKFYPGALEADELKQILKNYDDKTINILTPKILNGRYNTYTMTKGMAEELVSKHRSILPIVIFRPTIVSATFKEPWTNWINNIYGATGVFFAAGLGFLRTLYCNSDEKAEIIPADRVVNALVVVPKHIQKYWYNSIGENQFNKEPVYNFAMQQNSEQLTWGKVMDILRRFNYSQERVSDNMIWVYHLTLDKNYLVWLIKYYVLHLLPAPVFILMEKILKMPPRIWKGYIKLYRHTLLYSFFMSKSWKISQENTLRLYEDLNSTDKVLFNCSVNVDWIAYLSWMGRGMGTYLINIDWNSTPNKYAYWKMLIMYVLDRILIWTCRLLFLFSLWKVVLIIGHLWFPSYLPMEI